MTQTVIPTTEELATKLRAFRDVMPGGAVQVWFVVNEVAGVWLVTSDRHMLEGVYARCTVGKGDTDEGLRIAAENMIDRVRRYMEGRGDGEAFGGW